MNKKLLNRFILVVLICLFTPSLSFGENTIRILAIGNSFSEDAAEDYLDDLARAADVKVIIGNLYIGGCSLETHWNNALNNSANYEYRKIDIHGNKTKTKDYKLIDAITDEKWDYITFQQASPYSGQYDTFFPFLPNLVKYTKEHSTNPDVQFALHMTWAYAQNSTHQGFANYDNDQMTMYNAITYANYWAAEDAGIETIIPSGTAIQNGRTSILGDTFCRDGYHLNLKYGRYAAACVWLEKLLGIPAADNTFMPEGMSEEEANIAKAAAHYAVKHPFDITPFKYSDRQLMLEDCELNKPQ